MDAARARGGTAKASSEPVPPQSSQRCMARARRVESIVIVVTVYLDPPHGVHRVRPNGPEADLLNGGRPSGCMEVIVEKRDG
jgi:hypothetical protein